jgi:hypothetical protein
MKTPGTPRHQVLRTAILGIALAFSLPLPQAAAADVVVPSEQVRSRVVVREHGARASRDVGSLRPGERATWLGKLGAWHLVELADGTRGYVSASWTRVIAEAPVASAPPPPEALGEKANAPPSNPKLPFWKALWRRLFGPAPEIELVVTEPDSSRTVYRNLDPNLPVSGYATAIGSGGRFDVILAIDDSTSTNEFAQTDVDGDAVRDDEWKGRDSVFQAQIAAARSFMQTLTRLPGNRGGQRIQVGVVTFSGDDSYHLRPQDADFDPTPGAIYVLARRDAELRVPLTSDYAVVEAVLEDLSRTEPDGMTDFAAGIGRAAIELMGMEEWGARSRPRFGAQKLILFLSDGEPRLPYEGERAGRAAVEAAKLAARSGIRINTFALGKNPVTRIVNSSVKKMAARTNGRYVALENPGDIVSTLYATSFSFVDRVKLINQTTGRETDYIGTAIDGSFYGEIPLEQGVNEIEVVALLEDDREASETFFVEYEPGRPTRELSEQLERVREENEALIEKIKDSLAREIEEARVRRHDAGGQRKVVRMAVDKSAQEKAIEIHVDEGE